MCLPDELLGAVRDVVVDRLHPLFRQWASVLDAAVGVRVDDAAWPETLAKSGILGVVGMLRLVLGIEVI